MTAAVLSVFGGGATSTPAVMQAPCVDITRTLTVGSRGGDVGMLQVFLNVQKTGYFGPLTKQKLIDWQVSKKIVVSAKTAGAGTTGPKTRAALKCGVSAVTPTRSVVQQQAAPVVAATTSTPTTPTSVPTSSGGGGGSVVTPTVSPYGYVCAAVGDKPTASSCTTGTWQLSADEAGCIIWACMDSDDRG